MKLKRLEIVNFRNHLHSVLELDSFNVIRGANFAGKSSISQSISMLLSPSTMGLSADGKGFVTKIKRGADKSIIIGHIQGKEHLVEKTVELNLNTTGRTQSIKCIDDPEWHPSPFERSLERNKLPLLVTCNTDYFFGMEEKSQKSLLAQLALPSKYDFPTETVTSVQSMLGEGTINFSDSPFSVIEKAYKLLYKEREAVNRQVREFIVPEPLADMGVDASALQKILSDARERQKKLSKERDEAISQANGNNVSHVRLQTKIDSLSEKIKEEREKLTNLKGILLDEKREELVGIAEGKSEIERLEKERHTALMRISAKKAKLESYGKIASADGEECPTCHQKIDADTIISLQEIAQAEVVAAQLRAEQIALEIKDLGDVAGALKALEDHERAVKEKASIIASGQEKSKQLKESKEELEKLPKTDTETDVLVKFTKPLDEVDAEITSILEKLQPVMASEERRKEIETKNLQLAKLKEKAYKVDLLVKYFDKDGIKSVLLDEHVGGFVEKMNHIMSAFGYMVALDIEPEFQFLVTDTKDVTTPVKELSGAEQLMFAIALQCAVAKASGIGIVIADRLDTFLPSQRAKANKALYMLTKDKVLEQVVAIMSDTTEEVPNLPHSAFFMVEDGSVRRM